MTPGDQLRRLRELAERLATLADRQLARAEGRSADTLRKKRAELGQVIATLDKSELTATQVQDIQRMLEDLRQDAQRGQRVAAGPRSANLERKRQAEIKRSQIRELWERRYGELGKKGAADLAVSMELGRGYSVATVRRARS